jgi:hypothetical protein
MKKIFYLLAFTALFFTACQKQPVIPDSAVKHTPALALTLLPADYKLLDTTIYASKTNNFISDADAKLYVPQILAAKYPRVDDKSTADVTVAIGTPSITLPDSVFKDVAYTLTNADYLLLPGNKFTDFTAAQILSWLPYGPKTKNPVPNQLAILTFNYYSGTTTVQTFSYLYLNGAWQQIYMLSPAQYASVGRSSFNQFTSADDASLTAYINGILKADIVLTATTKTGDVKYVSFNYYSAAKVTSQRVIAFAFDGTNWVTGSTAETLSFERNGGKWLLNSAISYTLVKDDYTYIGTKTTAGSDAARANVAQYPDFNISAATDATFWSDTDLNAALSAVLVEKYKATANAGQKYIVTYTIYSFGKTSNTSKTFTYNGTDFVIAQ